MRPRCPSQLAFGWASSHSIISPVLVWLLGGEVQSDSLDLLGRVGVRDCEGPAVDAEGLEWRGVSAWWVLRVEVGYDADLEILSGSVLLSLFDTIGECWCGAYVDAISMFDSEVYGCPSGRCFAV